MIAEDLADASAPERILYELQRRNVEIDFLVNNAGFGTTGPFPDSDLVRELAMVQVNVTSLVYLTRLFLPDMITRRSGRILNLGSTAGFQPGPFMAVYYASKAFVNSFTEALAFELKGTGVTATVCCPGATATEFGKVAGSADSRLFRMGTTSARDVALHAYRAMMAGKRMSLPGWRAKLGLQTLRFGSRGGPQDDGPLEPGARPRWTKGARRAQALISSARDSPPAPEPSSLVRFFQPRPARRLGGRRRL